MKKYPYNLKKKSFSIEQEKRKEERKKGKKQGLNETSKVQGMWGLYFAKLLIKLDLVPNLAASHCLSFPFPYFLFKKERETKCRSSLNISLTHLTNAPNKFIFVLSTLPVQILSTRHLPFLKNLKLPQFTIQPIFPLSVLIELWFHFQSSASPFSPSLSNELIAVGSVRNLSLPRC